MVATLLLCQPRPFIFMRLEDRAMFIDKSTKKKMTPNDSCFKNKNCSTAAINLSVITFILCLVLGNDSVAKPESSMIKIHKNSLSYFIENKGQFAPNIGYYQKGLEQAVYYSRGGVHFVFLGNNKKNNVNSTLRLTMHGISANAEISGLEPRKGKINYFIGNDPKKWHTGISTFASVIYSNIYPNVDLRFHGQNVSLEYDVIAKPGADVSKVSFDLDGLESAIISPDGDLIATLSGGRKLVQRRPTIYQDMEDGRVLREGRFKIIEQHKTVCRFGFEIGFYDHGYPLIIDPLVIVTSSYLGGEELDYGWQIVADDEGNAYVTGYTNSPNFPLNGPFQNSLGGTYDAFLTKVNADGSLCFSTYFGGVEREYCNAISLNPSGLPTIVGRTKSPDFPVTASAYQTTLQGESDAFVAQFTRGGSLVFSTYLGGSDYDSGYGIAIDGNGIIHVGGSTKSQDFPTIHPLQANLNGYWDIYVTKLSAGGSNLLYGTYFGGSSAEGISDLAIDGEGNIFVVGHTLSTDLPVVNAIQPERRLESDKYEAFVMKLNPDDNNLVFSTYFSGSEEYATPQITAIATDSTGNAYVVGRSRSPDFHIQNPFQAELNGTPDAFFSKFGSGGGLFFSSYLGGSGMDIAEDIAVDGDGNLYITGTTSSPDFPVKNAYQNRIPSTTSVFITKVNAGGDSLDLSTYLGGDRCDNGRSIAVDTSGNIYVTGLVASTNFPILKAFQDEKSGGTIDAFVVRMRERDRLIDRLWGYVVQFIRDILELLHFSDD
jgi:Beta-propeller repeat